MAMAHRFVPALLITLLLVLHAQLWFGRGSVSQVSQMKQDLTALEQANREARQRNDIAVFPLAMPLLSGPGAISAMVLLTTGAQDGVEYGLVFVALLLSGFFAIPRWWIRILGLLFILPGVVAKDRYRATPRPPKRWRVRLAQGFWTR